MQHSLTRACYTATNDTGPQKTGVTVPRILRSDGPSACVMTLSVALSTGCLGGTETSASDFGEAHGSKVPQADDSSGGMDGVGDMEAQASCRLPSEEDFRIETPESESQRLFNEVLASHLDELYEGVGRFASGDTKVLKGTVDILEHRSVLADSEDVAIDSTHAVASFGHEKITPFGSRNRVVLTVFDPNTGQMIRISQSSTSTSVCGVTSFYGGCLSPATCSDCLPELASVSDTLSLSFSALGTYGGSDQPEMRVDVNVDLHVVPPDELTMDDILLVNSTNDSPLRMTEPTLKDGTYVFEVSDSVSASSYDENGCEKWVKYETEWFVHQDCLLNYGVREFLQVEPVFFCLDQG